MEGLGVVEGLKGVEVPRGLWGVGVCGSSVSGVWLVDVVCG